MSYASVQHVPTTHEHYVKVVKHEVCENVSVYVCIYAYMCIYKVFVCVSKRNVTTCHMRLSNSCYPRTLRQSCQTPGV